MELLETYTSVADVVKKHHIGRMTLYEAINKKTVTKDGFAWSFKKDLSQQ